MKFSSGVFTLIVAGGIATVESMSIRGNTKTANKLMTSARRLEDAAADNSGGYYNNNNGYNGANNGGYNSNYNGANNGGQNGQYGQGQGQGQGQYGGSYGEMDEESMYFLNNYSIKLLSCIQGEQVINYENGETESSTVVFRLCPSGSCDANSELGCESGYGDYAVGINTFLEAYMEQQQDNQNYYGNGMVSYNQYGQEFDAEEYMECKEYEVEEGQDQQQNNYNQYNNNQYNNNNGQQQQNNYNQYNNNGQQNNNNQNNNGRRRQQNNYNYNNYQNNQFFIGPGCSADGTNIALGMYMDEYCSYPASVNFADIAYGWESGLPFSDGGLISMNCVACYGPDQDYNYELNEMCMESYQSSTSRCEVNMESYSYYGQSSQGCNYIDSLVESIYGNGYSEETDNSTLTTTWTTVNEVSTRFMDTLSTREARAFIAAMVLFSLSAFFGATLIGCLCVKKRKRAKRVAQGNKLLPEAVPMKRRRSSVVALVRSGTNGIAESVRSGRNGFAESVKTATTGVKVVVATAAAKSVASIRGKPSKKIEEDSAETTEVVYLDMEDTAAAKSVCSIRSKPSKKKEEDSAETTEVPYTNMEDPAEDQTVNSGKDTVRTHKSIKSRMSSMAAKTVASVRKVSIKKKIDDTKSTDKSEYKAPEPIVSAPAAASVKSSKSVTLAPVVAAVAAVSSSPVVVKDDDSAKSTKSKATSTAALVAVEDEASVKSTKSIAASVKSSKSSKSKTATRVPAAAAAAAAPLVVVKEDTSVKSTKSKATSVKSSKSSKSKTATIAPVVAAEAIAALVVVKEDASVKSTKSKPVSVKSSKSSKSKVTTPAPVVAAAAVPVAVTVKSTAAPDLLTPTPVAATIPSAPERRADVLDWMFGCGGKDEKDDFSVTSDIVATTEPVAPELAPVVAEPDVTGPVAPEPVSVEDATPAPTPTEPAKEAKLVIVEDFKPSQEPEPATVEPANEAKPAAVEPAKEEVSELATTVPAKTEVAEPIEAESTPEPAIAAPFEEAPAKSNETDIVISEEKSTTHSTKTEKTKGKKTFLTKMDSHLKKKLSKKA